MGYTTDFNGEVSIDPPLNQDEIDFLNDFNQTRRMHRSGGPLFVKGEGMYGQGHGPDTIFNSNSPDPSQPGLWCQWVPNDEGTVLEWDGGEKFYYSAEWMDYIVNKLLSPAAREYVDAHLDEDERLKSFTCNHVVNGEIYADGEESDDVWVLVVTNNVVEARDGRITYEGLAQALTHAFHGYAFEITSVGVDVRAADGTYLRQKVSLEEAVKAVQEAGL